MRIITRLVPVAAAVLLVVGSSGCAVPASPRAVWFGAHSPPAPYQGMASFAGREQVVGRLDITHFFQAWGGNIAAFNPTWVRNAAGSGRHVLLTWEPWAPGAGPEQPAFALRRINDGRYDAYIQSWADGLAAYGRTVYLRPMHEMNGNWYPWSGGVNGNTYAQYIDAWRRMYFIFRGAGATNVKWVWSVNAGDVPSSNDLERYYPGTRYVDVLGVDGYNWGSDTPEYGGWLSFSQIFSQAYARLGRLGPQPIWVTETASNRVGGDKAKWVRDMFASMRKFPRIQAIVWFDLDKERDWRMTSPTATAASFRGRTRVGG
jgi:beta-mannanase